MLTSLIETVELRNFGHMTTPKIKFELHNKSFFGDVITTNYDIIILISKYLYFKKPGIINFADIIKIANTLIKTSCQKS